MTNGTKEFHVSAILSAATGVLCGELNDLYDILSFMVDEELCTHQLPRAGNDARPYLYEQFPWLELADKNALSGNLEAINVLIAEISTEYGEYHQVLPMHLEDRVTLTHEEELGLYGVDADNIIKFDVDDNSKLDSS